MSSGNERYIRHVMLPEVGEQGQRRLTAATVAVVGLGGLGSPVCSYLAAAGVGRLVLIDPDPVELSNLNRQLLHWERDVDTNRNKVESAADKIEAFNSGVEVVRRRAAVDKDSVDELLDDADVVVDCVDNFRARIVLNDHCVRKGRPLVHGAVEEWRGQVTTIIPGRTPCLRCLFDREPARRNPIPILGAVAGTFGSIEAAEAIKLIIGSPDVLAGRLLIGDLRDHNWDVVEVGRKPGCPVCGHLVHR